MSDGSDLERLESAENGASGPAPNREIATTSGLLFLSRLANPRLRFWFERPGPIDTLPFGEFCFFCWGGPIHDPTVLERLAAPLLEG